MTEFGVAPRTSGPLWKKLEAQAATEQREPAKEYPTARAVAAAVYASSKLMHHDPIRCLQGSYHGCDGRYFAYWALVDLYGDDIAESLAKCVGAKRPASFVKKATNGRREFYIADEAWVEHVKGEIARLAS